MSLLVWAEHSGDDPYPVLDPAAGDDPDSDPYPEDVL